MVYRNNKYFIYVKSVINLVYVLLSIHGSGTYFTKGEIVSKTLEISGDKSMDSKSLIKPLLKNKATLRQPINVVFEA